jgi:biopolymer transport protein ExbD
MIKRLSRRRTRPMPDESLHIVGLWNLMVVLIPFLLLSAVVSETTILNLYLPLSKSEGAMDSDRLPILIVSITRDGFRIQKEDSLLPLIPKRAEGYDLGQLSSTLYSLKEEMTDQENLVLLSESDIPYEILVGVMDVCRERVILKDGKREVIPLFPNISIGEAEG